LWLAAHTAEELRNAEGYGFEPVSIRHDFGKLRAARDRFIEYLNGRYAEGLAKNGVRLLRERARFEDAHTLAAGNQKMHAEHILIATGAHPRALTIPGGELALDSDDFFKLNERPERVALIGAGYIAAEFGGIFAALGSHVDIYLGGREILAHFDPFIRETLTQAMEDDGINCDRAAVTTVEREGKGFRLATDDRKRHSYDTVIVATGRMPLTANLGLDAADVATDKIGAIMVDRYQTTSVKHIYAVGDVTGRVHALTPVAIAAGRDLSDRLFGGMSERHLDYEYVPTVVFSHPPVGTVGLTEAEARARHGDAVRVYTSRFTPLTSALVPHKRKAAIKLITCGQEERVIGLHVIGDGADELLQGFAVAIRMGATKHDFDDTIAIHPTLAEEVVTLK
ncbi:MAG: FAD-dependent oxidoreductase, partial [Gammaproteobacteria bacterium]